MLEADMSENMHTQSHVKSARSPLTTDSTRKRRIPRACITESNAFSSICNSYLATFSNHSKNFFFKCKKY